jgi:hypothetical protein
MLSVAVVVRLGFRQPAPTYCFVGRPCPASLSAQPHRMQDWESGSSSRQQVTHNRVPLPSDGSPISETDRIIPPILSGCALRYSPRPRNSLSGCLRARPCRHLSHPRLGMAAPDLSGVIRPNRHRCDETESLATAQDPAHSPCSRSHARPADHVSTTAGGLLPHRFAPYQLLDGAGGNTFCCGCSQDAALAGLPPLTVSWGDLVLPVF